jgi:hypothetical protein
MNKALLTQGVDLLAKYKKLSKFSTYLIHNKSVDYEIKSKSFIDSANAAVDYSKFLTSLALKMSNPKGTDTYDEQVYKKIFVYEESLDPLLENSLSAFENLNIELAQDKDFLILCLKAGVDGRLLSYVSEYIIFTNFPKNENDLDTWYETAEFDNEFFSSVAELNEHSFYGLWSNPKIEGMIADGFEKFDLWENESAWVSAGKNPKFLKYHDDMSLELVMKEWAGTAVERTLEDTIRKVSSNLPGFARSILPDYFNVMDLTQVEKQFNIKFDDGYLQLVAKRYEQMPALNNHDQSVEIYDLTNLSDFEATIRFIVSYEK